MNPSREELLFALVLTKPAPERAAWLDRECADDLTLRSRLETLLAADSQTEGLLAEVAPAAKQTLKLEITEGPDEAVGQTLGRYKLLERVGEGGCGVVYVAEQTEPVRRRVALKVIKLGMDTKQVVARFEAERQALAMMDHPNIAKVLDAGTTDVGRPFFVMELVRGIKITDYCDQANLSTKERLDLFIKVCHAIQHAHQKGIIHRDIKPSNILVTLHDGVPVPKVIDFGIAKATEGRLTDNTVYTQLHQFIGTPAYMSPEQAEMSGLDIDTRSDIYSLGVLLYELLAGSTPFDGQELMSHGIDAMRKTIREKEPARPSARLATLPGNELTTTAKRRAAEAPKLIHQLKGDLDWIVMKCLEKDRTRRYETANGVAADLKRHLNNEPVVARPPSTAYKFQKAFHRNKVAFAAGIAIAVALLLGMLGSTWQSVRANRAKAQADVEKQRANREAATANRVTEFLKQMLATANPDSSKSPDYTVRAMLDDFAAAIDAQFPDNPEVAAGLHTTIGKAFWNMQQYDKAKTQLTRALELRAAADETNSANYAESLVDFAETPKPYRSDPEREKSEAYLRRALAIYQARGIRGYPVIHALWALQMIFDMEGKHNEIERLVNAAREEARLTPGTNYWELPAMNNGLINAKVKEGKYLEAERIGRETIVENDRLFGPDYIQTAWASLNLNRALLAQSKYAEALAAAKQAVAIMRKRISPDQAWYGNQLAAVFNTLDAARSARVLTNLFSSADQLEPLEALFQERLGTKPLLPDNSHDPANVATRVVPQFPALYLELASELTAAGSTNQAAECRRKAVTLLEQLQTKNAGNPDLLAQLCLSSIQSLVAQGDLGEANKYREKLLALTHLNAYSLNTVAWALATSGEPGMRDGSNAIVFAEKAVAATSRMNASYVDTLAAAYAEAGEFTNAVRFQQEAISLLTEETDKKDYGTRLSLYRSSIPYRDNDWRTFNAESMLGGSLLGQKKYAEAEPLLLAGYEGMKQREDKIPPTEKVRPKEAIQRLVQLYQVTGQTDKAAEWIKKVEAANPPASR